MCLDRLLAQEELFGDLRVRLPVDHESRDLELPAGEGTDAAVRFGGPSPPGNAATELPQFALSRIAISESTKAVKLNRGSPQLGHRLLRPAGLREGAGGGGPREGGFGRGANPPPRAPRP